MDIYAHATFWSFETALPRIGVADDDSRFEFLGYNDLMTVVVGTRIRF
jgi:hypothetical protein